MRWYRRLHWQTLMAMGVGALTGLIFGETAASTFGWIGDLFMKLLRMIIVPLVFTSIIAGVASVGGGKALGRLFSKTLGYYVLSSLVADGGRTADGQPHPSGRWRQYDRDASRGIFLNWRRLPLLLNCCWTSYRKT